MKRNVILVGLLAAMVGVATTFLHVPIVGGGYVHMGDTVIYLAAALLPTPYAMAAAAVGAGLADLLVAPMWAPFTVVIKAAMVRLYGKARAAAVPPQPAGTAAGGCGRCGGLLHRRGGHFVGFRRCVGYVLCGRGSGGSLQCAAGGSGRSRFPAAGGGFGSLGDQKAFASTVRDKRPFVRENKGRFFVCGKIFNGIRKRVAFCRIREYNEDRFLIWVRMDFFTVDSTCHLVYWR